MFAGRKFFVFAEVAGAERFRDFVFFPQPFAEVNEFAATRAEGPIGTGEPIAFLFAGGTFDLANRSHLLRCGKLRPHPRNGNGKRAVDKPVYSDSFGGPGLGIIFYAEYEVCRTTDAQQRPQTFSE